MTPKPQEHLFKKEYAKQLLAIAKGDFESAKVLKEVGRGRKENVCFMAQQSIEKALKSVLCWHQVAFPLVHDAGILVAKMPQGVHPPSGYDLSVLTSFATNRRYEEGSIQLSLKDMESVLSTAQKVLAWAEKEIGQ